MPDALLIALPMAAENALHVALEHARLHVEAAREGQPGYMGLDQTFDGIGVSGGH